VAIKTGQTKQGLADGPLCGLAQVAHDNMMMT